MKIVDHNLSIASEIEVKDVSAANTKKISKKFDLTRDASQDNVGGQVKLKSRKQSAKKGNCSVEAGSTIVGNKRDMMMTQ